MVLYLYKTHFINLSQRGSQLVSSALHERALFLQEVNQNVMEVVNAPIATRNENLVETLGVKRKRGRPPKRPPNLVGIILVMVGIIVT